MQEKLTKDQKRQVKKEVDKQLKFAEKKIESVEKKLEKEVRIHKKFAKHLRKHSTHIVSKFRDHASTAIIAALSFLIAIAWKDLIINFIKETIKIESLEKYPYLADLYTALIVTLVAVALIIMVANWVKKEE